MTSTSEEDGHLVSHLPSILLLAKVILDLTRMDYQWKLQLTMAVEHMEYKKVKAVHFTTIKQVQHDIIGDNLERQLIFEILE